MLLTCVGIDDFLQNFIFKETTNLEGEMEEQKERTNIKKKKKKGLKGKTYPHGVDHDKTHHCLG
jgi:hypothetical protein